MADNEFWATADPVHYGPPVGTPVRSALGRLTPAEPDVEETDDGPVALGGAYDPVRSPGVNVAGLSSWASNGEDSYDMGTVSAPYNPDIIQVRPGFTPGAREFSPTESVFLNDLLVTRGPGHFAQPVAAGRISHVPAPAWGKMRPQPITRPRGPEDMPVRPRTFTRSGVFV